MRDTNANDGRTGYEHSPSTGWREIPEQMHAPRAHAVEPENDADEDAENLEVFDTMLQETTPTPEVAP